MKTKEIKSVGFCIVRHELTKDKLSVPVGGKHLNFTEASRPLPYRWLNDDEGFQIRFKEQWLDAESIDFDFLVK